MTDQDAVEPQQSPDDQEGVTEVALESPASVVSVRCRVEWVDTDASGHYHHGTVVRWLEVAEAELFRVLGAEDLYGRIPRVHYEVDYLSPAWFGDLVDVELFVESIGVSSLAMSFEVRTGSATVARGSHTVVHIDKTARRAEPWPQEVRSRILDSCLAARSDGTATPPLSTLSDPSPKGATNQ